MKLFKLIRMYIKLKFFPKSYKKELEKALEDMITTGKGGISFDIETGEIKAISYEKEAL